MPPPQISVVMPVWNGERYLREAVDSILAQTFADFEFIVVDDGSTDATTEILASYHDPRLRSFRLDHAGIVVALNSGIAQARGGWIARQDADDVSKPDRLEKQRAALNRNPGAVLCYTGARFFGEGSPPKRLHFPRTRSLLALELCSQCPITHSTVLFRKQSFLEAGGYRPEERHAEDFSLWGRMLELGDFAGLPENLLDYRCHVQSVTKQNYETQMALAVKISIGHCRRFMRLPIAEAQRAQAILRTLPRERRWSDWGWFLTRCAPRLRWKSAETCASLSWQTLRLALRR
jgi:glycosyltransferase involved in cell wall biosynthesis